VCRVDAARQPLGRDSNRERKIHQCSTRIGNFRVRISVEYQDENQGNSGCTYFESKLRNPTRARAECGNVEPGSDYLEMASVLTLTTVSEVSIALLAGGWLLRRSFRNWQLRRMIMHDKAAARLQIHKGRRRSSGLIKG
jgi:hypothetical protein